MKKNKGNIFRGITAVLASTLCLAGYMSVLAFEREGDINAFLQIKPPSQTVTDDTNYFPSAYDSEEKRLAAEKDFIERTQEEGSVLLKNDNHALPLTSNERKVTLFGRTATDNIFRGGSGGASNADSVTLKAALESRGFEINKPVYDALAAVNLKRGNGEIAEAPASTYNGLSYTGYTDAAIVVLGRYGGEANDLDVSDKYGVPELSLHQAEKEMLEIVKNAGFKKIIVLVNSGYAMDLGWLDDYNVDACLYIGYPGRYGMNGVADLLIGENDPSGHLVDTFAENSLSSPAMQNFGDYVFTNLQSNAQYKKEYLIYAEDIYVGYKYYETRYQDQVLGINNATSSAGVYNSENNSWDYADEMAFPFGSGLSYADFTQEVTDITWNQETHEVIAKVKVTNNGSDYYDGTSKSVVQLYAQLPYEAGMASKSAVQLIGYAKTKPLAKGESDEVTITVSDYLFATYDDNAVNGADESKKGCYIFDEGDYYFAIGNNVHDALNNILAARDVKGLFDEEGVAVEGDASKVKKETLAEYDNTTYAKSETGEIVSNRFDDRDINYFYDEDVVTYLTRDDWNTFPKSYTGLTAADEIASKLSASTNEYTKPSDAPDIDKSKFGQEQLLKLIEFKDKDYDDPDWDKLISQMTLPELYTLVGEHMGNDAIESVGYPANVSNDGPDGLIGATNFNAEVISASTWNKELIEERGEMFGEQALAISFGMTYSPGANAHRTPYGGRNYEYYSEDSIMSYYCGWYQTAAMREKGLISAIKHFCGNDQETNRHGVATFMNEQTYRQGALKGFEGAFVKGKTLGTMTAFNRIGCEPTASDYETMTGVLRNEWGFQGINITDSSRDATTYMFTADCIMAGTDFFNNDTGRIDDVKNYIVSNRDGNIFNKVREIAHHVLYAYSRSNVMNGLTVDTAVTNFVPWWETAIYAFDGTLGGLTAISLGAFIFFAYIKKNKPEEDKKDA